MVLFLVYTHTGQGKIVRKATDNRTQRESQKIERIEKIWKEGKFSKEMFFIHLHNLAYFC